MLAVPNKIRVLALSLLAALVAVFAIYLLTRNPPDIRELVSIRGEWDQAQSKFFDAYESAKGPELAKAREARDARFQELAERCLKLTQTYPGTAGELGALYLAACRAPQSDAGQKAYQMLASHVATMDLAQFAEGVRYSQTGGSRQAIGGIAPALLARVKQNPSHPQAAQLATLVCCISRDKQTEPAATFTEAADLIIQRYGDSPDLINFCECLGFLGARSPIWAGRYEQHLRAILKANPHRSVRCAASFALASVIESTDQGRRAEAEQLWQQFAKEFDGNSPVDENGKRYAYQQIEQQEHNLALMHLDELRKRATGMPAPEIVGMDLDGRPMKLSDSRGKVVLLSFWATWCGPCMKMIPHERELLRRFQGKAFTIIGVNGDDDQAAAKRAVGDQAMTWRSFRDPAQESAISGQWKIIAMPTFYLLDHKGIIREHWAGSPPTKDLDHAVGQLVKAVP